MARGEREREILDAAAAVFGARGYAHTSVAEVAEAADVSKTLIFDYFGSKDGLFRGCLDRAGRRLVAEVAAAQETAPDDRVLPTLRALFDALEPSRADWQVLHDATVPGGSELARAAQTYQAQLLALAAEGTGDVLQARGLTGADQVALAARIWVAAVTACVEWWLTRPDLTADEMAALCADVLAATTTLAP